MKDHCYIETLGTIIKKETLASIEEDLCDNSLVVENIYPYPGYHGTTIPDDMTLTPDSIFIAAKQLYDHETVCRTACEIRKKFKGNFDAAPGMITVFNEMTPCIRIKQLDNYRILPELIGHFKDHGFQFMKYKRTGRFEGIIKINKFFVIEELNDKIYIDHEEKELCYLPISKQLDWDTFEEITLDMKRNMPDSKFDAALGTIFRKNQVIDLIRIFDKHIDTEKINQIKERYLNEIEKL